MQFIDTHAHLYDEAYNEDREQVIARAADAGITKMVLPDIDSQSRDTMFSLADKYSERLFPCLGVHPTSVNEDWEKEVENMFSYLPQKKIWAIGEVGLDCYWSKEHLAQQQTVFRIMLETAHKLSLPVVIHSRDSTELIINILKDYRHLGLKGVFHAYSGSRETYRELQDTGDWYIGIGGVLTFKKASIAETVKDIPIEKILLETDAPYLTPAPHRGRRNESAYIPLIASRLAELKGTDIAGVASQTSANAEKLFGI